MVGPMRYLALIWDKRPPTPPLQQCRLPALG